MEHETQERGDALVVILAGEVDLEHSPTAREVLLAAVSHKRKVLVDLAGVEYIDSSGVASLVEAYKIAKNQGQGFALVAVNPAALRVLRLARLDRVFSIFDKLEEAL